MTKNLVAVVPIRKGSQRVKNKNFKPFAGKNLLIHKIKVLKKIKKIDEIIINTDSDRAIQIAKDYGVSFKKREKYFASSECINSDFWSHIAENTDSKFIMFTHCTNPLVKVETYNKIINSFLLKNSNSDSINTVTDVKEFLYLKNKPLNFNPNKSPNSQNLPNIVKINFAVTIISKKLMAQKKTLMGKKPIFYNFDLVLNIFFKHIILLFEINSFSQQKYLV